MRKSGLVLFALGMVMAASLYGCSGTDGAVGPAGAAGPAGATPADTAGSSSSNADAGSVATSSLPASVPALQLPGSDFYPENLASAADGTLFVGSVATGEVVRFSPGSTTPELIVKAASPVINIAGQFVDDSTQSLFICADSFSGGPAELRSYGFDGTLKKTYAFPDPGALCSDMALDAKHNMYIADAKGGEVYVLTDPSGTLEKWAGNGATDPSDLLKPKTAQGFGADGIVFDAATNSVYVNNNEKAGFLRIPVNADGSAGVAVSVTVTPALEGPDGMRYFGSELVVVENLPSNGRLTKLTFTDANTAIATTLMNGLDGPTGVAFAGGSFWISEGQIGHYLGFVPGPPNLPFLVRRLISE